MFKIRGKNIKSIFLSLVFVFLFVLEIISDGFAADVSTSYRNNLRVISNWKEPESYLVELDPEDEDDSYIINLSNKIVNNKNSDYEKLEAIYQWVIDNIYYDYVAYEERLGATIITELDEKRYIDEGFSYWLSNAPVTTAVLRRGVCADYSILMKYLLCAQGIPCMYVTGYIDDTSSGNILCVEKNKHAWNAAYVDERWILFDATWDSGNKYIADDTYCAGESSKNYFDISLKKLSEDHFFIE